MREEDITVGDILCVPNPDGTICVFEVAKVGIRPLSIGFKQCVDVVPGSAAFYQTVDKGKFRNWSVGVTKVFARLDRVTVPLKVILEEYETLHLI